MKKKILFTGGGTLGHIFPLVPVAKILKEKGYDLYFIGTKSGLEKDLIEGLKIFTKTYYLDSRGIKRSLSLKNIVAIYKHFLNKHISKKILKDLNIDLVVGMGGYVSGGVVSAAIKLKIKTAIHEQNSVYGLANKLVKNKVDKVLLSYDIDKNKNTVVVGNPRISEIYEKYKYYNSYNLGNYVLVVGGSRGAKRINDTIINLKDKFKDANINIILITGDKYYKENLELIKKTETENFKILNFVKDLPMYLIEAKVVVTRSGATTLAEVMALRKLCIFIPSPNVTNNHQELNAKSVCDFGGGVMIKECELTEELLFNKINELYHDNNLRNRIINNIIFNTDLSAASKFTNELIKLIGNNY